MEDFTSEYIPIGGLKKGDWYHVEIPNASWYKNGETFKGRIVVKNVNIQKKVVKYAHNDKQKGHDIEFDKILFKSKAPPKLDDLPRTEFVKQEDLPFNQGALVIGNEEIKYVDQSILLTQGLIDIRTASFNRINHEVKLIEAALSRINLNNQESIEETKNLLEALKKSRLDALNSCQKQVEVVNNLHRSLVKVRRG